MKGLVIVNGYPSDEKFIRQGKRIADELTALGVDTELIKNGDIYAVAGDSPFAFKAAECDFAVYLDKDKYLGRVLEGMGVRLFNSAKSIELCDDKMSTYQALAGIVPLCKSIPAPLCYTKGASVNESFLQRVGEELGFPLVAKKSYGSFGKGVQLVHGYAELRSLAQEWLYEPHFYQQYIASSCGRDIRVLVIGGKAVACMERVAKAGEFRSNIELGGSGRKIRLPESYRIVAEKAAVALGLDYCGVDLLTGERGALVCEVNSNAFFEGLERVTGVNVASLYANYIVNCRINEKNAVEK